MALTSTPADTGTVLTKMHHCLQTPTAWILHSMMGFKRTMNSACTARGTPVANQSWTRFWCYGTKKVWSPPCWPLHQALCCWQPRLVHALICLFGHMPVTPDCGTCVLCLTVVQLCGLAGAGGENMHSNLLSPTSGWVHRPNVE